MNPTIGQLIIMMHYLGVKDFLIPSYSMQFPQEVHEHYRSEKLFRLQRDGTMMYIGFDNIPRSGSGKVIVCDIKLNQSWIDRAFLYLSEHVRCKMRGAIEQNALSISREQAKTRALVLLKFNGLDFISPTQLLDASC